MKLMPIALGVAIAAGAAAAASAAVTPSEVPPKSVRDLVALCTPAADDPMMTAAINYCHGYVEGAVIVENANQNQRHARKLFCLPTPPPASDAELASFVGWANQQPARLDEPAIDGMFLYLAQRFPCGKQQ